MTIESIVLMVADVTIALNAVAMILLARLLRQVVRLRLNVESDNHRYPIGNTRL